MGSAESSNTARHAGQSKAHRGHPEAIRSVASYATSIGRIGALALALGVGAAVAGFGGTAWADDSANGTISPGSGENSSPAGTTGADAKSGAAVQNAADSHAGNPASPTMDRPGPHVPRVIVGSGGARPDAPESRVAALEPDAASAPEPDGAPELDSTPAPEPDSASTPDISLQQDPSDSSDAPLELPSIPRSQDTPASVRLDHLDTPTLGPATSAPAAPSPEQDRQKLPPIISEVSNSAQRAVKDYPATTDTFTTSVTSVPTSVASQGINSSDLQLATTALTSQPAPQIIAAPLVNSITQVLWGLLGTIGISATNGSLPLLPLQALMGALDLIRREIEQFLSNDSPTLAYNPAENIVLADGSIVGDLNPADTDSATLTYTVTDPPNGSVVVNPDGTFIYKHDDGATGSDSFFVTVSDTANGYHIHGLSGLLNLVTFGLLGDSGHGYTKPVTVGLERTVLASDLYWPTDFQFLPDGRILMANFYGAVVAYDNNTGQLQSESVILFPATSEDLPRLYGIAVDPNFAENGYIYVVYVEDVTTDRYERVSRLTVTDPSADVLTIDPLSELLLLEGDQPSDDGHHGAAIRFGPDGKLYVAVGNNDFFYGNYQIGDNAQTLTNIYGKILRLNPDGTAPTDNPFFDQENPKSYTSYIYALGFRNPFKMTFTPDGQLLVVDAGESTWEEVNNVTAGGNYGWPLAEGPCDGIGNTTCSAPSSYEIPILAYLHTGGASSITGAFVFTGSTYGASYQNTVFVTDFNQGWIAAVTCTVDYSSCGSGLIFDSQAGPTVSLAVGPDGHIYQLKHADPSDLNGSTPSGELARYT